MSDNVFMWLLIAVLVGFVLGRSSRNAHNDRFAEIDRKLTMLTDHFKLKWDPTLGVSEEVLSQVRAGNKVEAIRLYRDATGKTLKEAHERIEQIDRRFRFRI
jgi:hypothetical protein